MELRPISPALGVEVVGVDLAANLDDQDLMAEIKRAFIDHHVLVFRDQDLDRETHKAFGRIFGELHIHPSNRRPGTHDPEIFVVSAGPDTVLNNGGHWHTDVSCDEIPPLGSMLLLTEAPTSGGDTLFANMHLAYETLSPPVQAMLCTLTARHDQRNDIKRYGYEPKAGVTYPAHSHPVVIAHPETGNPTLYVNASFTTHLEGLSERESDALLAMLHAHVAGSPALQCRVRWEPGTLTCWDNRATQHYAVWDYQPQRRRGERVTIAGSQPLRPAVPQPVAEPSSTTP